MRVNESSLVGARDVSAEIGVIGAGYVGLTSSACFAYLGHEVVCADVDRSKIDLLNSGRIGIHEQGLAAKVEDGLTSKRLSFVTDPAEAVAKADFVFLCLPTPPRKDGSADLSFIFSAVSEIAQAMQPATVLVSKSTVPPGTSELLERILARADVTDVAVAHNPEFLREGTAVNDFLQPDRVVIGANDQSVADKIAGLYANIPTRIVVTDTTTAETTKYVANAFLATKLSFVNSAAALCEVLGADVKDVMTALGHDRRIGAGFLKPGPGWGGSCLPKDSRALVNVAATAGYDFSLLRRALEVNERQFDRIVAKVADRVVLEGARVALLGLAFKAETDDIRSSPSLEIAQRLIGAGAKVHAYDPAVTAEDLHEMPGLVVESDAYVACAGASALLIATEWNEFRQLDVERIATLMYAHHIIDARNLLHRDLWVKHGFTYTGVGTFKSDEKPPVRVPARQARQE